MVDKPIIIDRVDVSKCSYFNFIDEHYCYECSSEFGCAVCDERTDCYYKQLKRKEQECEELNEYSVGFAGKCQKLELDVFHLKDKNYNLQRQLYQLKEENDTLRQFLSKEPLALQALQSGYASHKKSSDVLYEMVKQYKQTLSEIKEIAETCSFTDSSELLLKRIKQILRKISEVENEET